MIVKNRLRQLIELSPLQWRILLFSIFLLPLIALSLEIYSFKQTKKKMSQFIPSGIDENTPNEQDLVNVKSISRAVAIAGNHGIYRTNCLKQSLLLWWFLARRGVSTEIKYGIEDEPVETFSAHAWVEYDGVNISNPEETVQRFSGFSMGRAGNTKFHIEI